MLDSQGTHVDQFTIIFIDSLILYYLTLTFLYLTYFIFCMFFCCPLWWNKYLLFIIYILPNETLRVLCSSNQKRLRVAETIS